MRLHAEEMSQIINVPVSPESVQPLGVGSQPGVEGTRLAEAEGNLLEVEGSLLEAAGSPAVEDRPVEAHCSQ